ncbi:MAG: RNA polymerase sigma-70 factor [Gemmatimonadota bacterium]|nr:RNA polymerase sigma-70 factor [Gemmatimonadota bacterium]
MLNATTRFQTRVQVNPLQPSTSDDLDLFRVWARKIRESDAAALEAFFRAVHGPLVRYATRFVAESTAEDVVQDAFVRLWESRARIDPGQSLKAFAYRTVRNLCLNRIRDAKTQEKLLSERYEAPTVSAPEPDEELAREDFADRLRGWIAELPERQREALELSRFHGLSHEQVAEAMGVSPRTVNNHLVKALHAIRDRVRAHEPSLLDS